MQDLIFITCFFFLFGDEIGSHLDKLKLLKV